MQTLGKIAITAILSLLAWSDSSDTTAHGQEIDADAVVLTARKFDFPFQMEAGSAATKIRLYVSTDRGNTWRLAAEEPITTTRLPFTATSDGDHWFATATDLEQAGTDSPVLAVQRKVYIDSTGPTIELNAFSDTAGNLTGTLELKDPSRVAALRVLYATDVVPEWKIIANHSIDASGVFQFRPAEDWGKLSLHLTATDSLGNVAVDAKTIRRPRIAAAPKSTFADQPVGDQTPNRLRVQLAAGPQRPANLLAGRSTPAAEDDPSESQVRPSGTDDSSQPATINEVQLPPTGLTAKTTPQGVEVIPPPRRSSTPSSTLPASDAGSATESLLAPSAESAPSTDRPRTLAQAMRPMASEVPATETAPVEEIPTPAASETPEDRRLYRAERAEQANRDQQARFDRAQLAQTTPIRFSDSNRFSLDYELEAVGNSGIETVELYGSLDGGKIWKRWGADPDRQSPFDIETKGEGVFAFRIVVLGNNGLASPRPLAGDPPDIAIVVDQTLPEIKITSARYGEGSRTGSLEIRYQCEDENLTNRPIAIAFSDSLKGPWTTIAAGLRNDGLYVWPADPQLPRRIFLRVDATDQAGNRGTYLLDQPIETQGLAPRGRILGFRSR